MKLLAILYLTYGCMHLSPVRRIRRWAATTWWRLVQESPEDIWEDNLPADSPMTFTRMPAVVSGVIVRASSPEHPGAEEPRAA